MEKCNEKKAEYVSGLDMSASKNDETILDFTQYPFSTAVSILRYLVDSTRPDLAFITGALARHMTRPTRRHWTSLKAVPHYVAGTKDFGLLYSKGHPALTGHQTLILSAAQTPDNRHMAMSFRTPDLRCRGAPGELRRLLKARSRPNISTQATPHCRYNGYDN